MTKEIKNSIECLFALGLLVIALVALIAGIYTYSKEAKAYTVEDISISYSHMGKECAGNIDEMSADNMFTIIQMDCKEIIEID